MTVSVDLNMNKLLLVCFTQKHKCPRVDSGGKVRRSVESGGFVLWRQTEIEIHESRVTYRSAQLFPLLSEK